MVDLITNIVMVTQVAQTMRLTVYVTNGYNYFMYESIVTYLTKTFIALKNHN